MNIDEIARMAGVSNAAVSRYFNNGYISREKKEAIRKVIEKTGYKPSAQARMLRIGKTMSVLVITTRIAQEPFSATLTGIISVLEEQGYQIILHLTGNDPAQLTKMLESVNEKAADGMILINHPMTQEHRKLIRQTGIPCVIVGEQVEGVSCVFHDDRQMVYEATRKMILQGCRKLFYIGVRKHGLSAAQERKKGFTDAVLDSEELTEKDILAAEAGYTVEQGYEALRVLIEENGMPDGIVCGADVIGAGSVKLLKENGLSVPGDVLVSGIGDTQIACAASLLTIRCYYEQRGEIAGHMLLDHMTDPGTPIRAQRLGYSFIDYSIRHDNRSKVLQEPEN